MARIVSVNVDTISEPKSPMMDPTADDISLQITTCQRGSCVWTTVIQRKKFISNVKHTDPRTVDYEHPAFALGNLAGFTNGLVLGHGFGWRRRCRSDGTLSRLFLCRSVSIDYIDCISFGSSCGPG